MKVRRPCQAGAFYAGSPTALHAEIEECFLHRLGPGKLPKLQETGPRRILALISPHAGYMYSGPVAAHSYYALALDGKPALIVILGPNHTGLGSGISIMADGSWKTPFGNVEVDKEVAEKILRASKLIDVDDTAHAYEHSIEVQLPFLQYLYGSAFRFVPICMMLQDLETSQEVGAAIANAVSGIDVVLIASTDFSHYVPQLEADRNDHLALDAILKLDEVQLQSVVETYNISMCGYGPVTAVITAAKQLGASSANLLCYRTSGDVTGDRSAVVGYAAVSIVK
ncbi:AmmeMemoRadiSam system protein B [Candidatus Bathyarchaeota archaeon]|nr:AmmeMemoRadiSam system protein B [Candidatus Bathyarchaeota archaeon]